jgi:hypothetical protein
MTDKTPRRTGSAPSGPGARLALAAGALIAGYGALMALPAGPPAASSGIGVAAEAPAAPMPTSDPSAAPDEPAAPHQLTLPELGAGAPVLPVTAAADGSLGIPDDPTMLGWWRGGAKPGDAAGAVVIDGHVDSDKYGIGFFVNLRRLRDGNHVLLADGSGTVTRWRVVDYKKYPRDLLPADQLFTTDGPLRLILVTCGGVFDHASHSYPDNLVVLAIPDPA